MTIDEKALEAAARAVRRSLADIFEAYRLLPPLVLAMARATIEAYLAALPPDPKIARLEANEITLRRTIENQHMKTISLTGELAAVNSNRERMAKTMAALGEENARLRGVLLKLVAMDECEAHIEDAFDRLLPEAQNALANLGPDPIAAAVAAERERCAGICDDYCRDGTNPKEYAVETADELAARIRNSTSEKPPT